MLIKKKKWRGMDMANRLYYVSCASCFMSFAKSFGFHAITFSKYNLSFFTSLISEVLWKLMT